MLSIYRIAALLLLSGHVVRTTTMTIKPYTFLHAQQDATTLPEKLRDDGFGQCPAFYHTHDDGLCYDNDDVPMRDKSKALPVPGADAAKAPVDSRGPSLPVVSDGWAERWAVRIEI